jgi:hypothetical protein
MFNSPNGKLTLSQVLLPVGVLAFVVFVMLAFQFTQILRDREAMHQAKLQQDKPLEEAVNVQNQLNALAVGTQKLADKGNKGAKGIIERMNKLGIQVNVGGPGAPGAGAPPAGGPPARAPLGAAPSRQAPPPPLAEPPPVE